MLDDKDKVWAAVRYQHIEYAKKFIAKTFQQFVDENKAGKFAKEKNVSQDHIREIISPRICAAY